MTEYGNKLLEDTTQEQDGLIKECFSKLEFEKQFKLLSTGNTTEREAANQYIIRFQASQEAWSVARQIIIDPPSVELQCLGAQILCKKLRTNYSFLSTQQKLELRRFLFEILQQFCQGQAGTVSNLAKTQVILSIAVLGFTGIHSDWNSFFDDITAFMELCKMKQNNILLEAKSKDESYILVGLEIFENVGNSESMEKIVQDMKIFQRIRFLFQEHAPQLSTIFNTLLVHPSASVGLATLKCIESWAGSQFKYQLFADKRLIEKLILLFSSTDESLFEKVALTILEGIRNSRNAEILETASITQSLSLLQGDEIQSFKSLIDALVSRVDTFLQSEEVIPDNKFCKFYVEIVTELAQKFTILILEKSEYSKKLLRLMVICTQHSNRFISQTTFDFWISFYRTLKTYVLDISESSNDWLIEPYLEVFRTVLQKCKLKKLQAPPNSTQKNPKRSYQLLKKYSLTQEAEDPTPYAQFSFGNIKIDEGLTALDNSADEEGQTAHMNFDLDQIDSEFSKIRVKEYRIYARDIFNTVFNVLNQFRGQYGVNSLLQILYSLMDKQQFMASSNFADISEATNEYYIAVEVCLFVVQTMAENMFNGGAQEENYVFFLNFIVNNKEFPAHQSTVKMAMQLFYNAQSELTKNLNLFDATIKFILKYILDDNLGLMSSQTFCGIIKGIGQTEAIETFKYVAQFFIENASQIQHREILDEFIQGVFAFALNLRPEAVQSEAISTLLQLIQTTIQQQKNQLENTEISSKIKETILFRVIGILQSILSSFSTETIGQKVLDLVAKFIGENFQFLIVGFEILTQKMNSQSVIAQFIAIFRHMTKIFSKRGCDMFFYEQYINFLNASVRISQRSPVLYCETMKIFKMVLDLSRTPDYSPHFIIWLQGNFNSYNEFYLRFMRENEAEKQAISDLQVKNSHEQAPFRKSSITQQNKDPDLITYFYDIQYQVIKSFSEFYLTHQHFRNVVEFSLEVLQHISQYEMARSILNFYQEFIQHCAHCQGAQDIVLKILDVTIEILPSISSHLLHNISLLLLKFAESFQNERVELRESILNCFVNKDKYSQFSNSQKIILTDCIVMFSLDLKNVTSLQSLLSDFYQVCREIYPPQEMFLNYEMKLKGLGHSQNNRNEGNTSVFREQKNINNLNSDNTNNINISQSFLSELQSSLLARNQSSHN